MTVVDDVKPETEEILDFDTPDVDPRIDIPDPPDADPLFSSLTGKTYKTPRGKKAGETRFRNKFGAGSLTTSKPSLTNAQLRKSLKSFYETAGMIVGALLGPPDGQAIIDNADGCSVAMAEWAESDPRVRAAMERMMTTSIGMKVVMAHAPIALTIAANHGFNPLERLLGGRNGQYDSDPNYS